jgi:hypothetical protein
MPADILIEFQRDRGSGDCVEEVSNFLLKPLRLACGQVVFVSKGSSNPYLEQEKCHLIVSLFFTIFALTLWLPGTLVGLCFVACSLSHERISRKFHRFEASSPPSLHRKIALQSLGVSATRSPSRPSLTSVESSTRKAYDPSDAYFAGCTPLDHHFKKDLSCPLALNQVKSELAKLSAKWYRNPHEKKVASFNTREEKEAHTDISYDELRGFNASVCRLVREKKPHITTPEQIFWSLQSPSWTREEPKPILEKKNVFILENHLFYGISPKVGPPLKHLRQTTSSFGQAVIRRDKQLYLYMDGVSSSDGLFINHRFFPNRSGKGMQQAIYRFSEGDDVYSSNRDHSRYLFTVGENGSIIYSDQKRHRPDGIGKAALEQTEQFEYEANTTTFTRSCWPSSELPLTTNPQAAIVGFDETITPGFSYYSKVRIDHQSSRCFDYDLTHRRDQKGDLIFVDPAHDPSLQALITYFKEEFAIMNYTEQQKMARLCTFVATLFPQDSKDDLLSQNYYLGEIAKTGRGACRHRATLIKVLADSLGIQCALVASLVNVSHYANGSEFVEINGGAHVWNLASLDGTKYLVDAMTLLFYPIETPPGSTEASINHYIKFYGLAY